MCAGFKMYISFALHSVGNGDQFVRYCEYAAGTWNDEILEGQTHNPEETGKF